MEKKSKWSLYKRKEVQEDLGKGLFNYEGELMPPLKFSNGKTQEDVVNEILSLIEKGKKTIFVRGVCGTGKSAIALNLAKNFKKTSIVVPIKSLQEQYERDYAKEKFVLKGDNNPLKISVIKGRSNFPCHYTQKKADDPKAPCAIQINESNLNLMLEYIDENPLTKREDFSRVSDIKRINVAPACPYWSPIMPADVNPRGIKDFIKIKYTSVSGKEYAIFRRKRGCPFYDQYEAYGNADVIIFNSAIYQIESALGRKPKTELEIIDECDEFLDSFATERKINLNRLQNALISLSPEDKKRKNALKEILNEINSLLFNPPKINVEKLAESRLDRLFDLILENPNLAEEEEINYFNNVLESFKSFENLKNETYVSSEIFKKEVKQKTLFGESKKEDQVLVTLVSINLAEKFREIQKQNNVLVLMSGTIHSEEVLRDVFGLDDFVIVEAETKQPGEIIKYRTGLEKNCSFSSFRSGQVKRKEYLKILDLCLSNAKNPTLVHVSAFSDLPTREENEKYKFDNLITQEDLREEQINGHAIFEFLDKKRGVLFTTKCSRGMDFPGDKCNTIILTRYPYPNIQNLFWKILKKEQPEKFMEFYMDKAKRELVQKVARGVRFKGDKIEILSPDIRVLNESFD